MILPLVFDLVRPMSVVDVGCGTGAWLAVASRLGATEVLGIDATWVPQNALLIPADCFIEHDLDAPVHLGRRFDLAICMEVAEHLEPARSDSLIADLCDLADVVLFSAAIPGQTGLGDRNEQWPLYWLARFLRQRYELVDCLRPRLWSDDRIEWWYVQNSFLYVSAERLMNDQRLQAGASEAGRMPLCVVHPRLFGASSPPRTRSRV